MTNISIEKTIPEGVKTRSKGKPDPGFYRLFQEEALAQRGNPIERPVEPSWKDRERVQPMPVLDAVAPFHTPPPYSEGGEESALDGIQSAELESLLQGGEVASLPSPKKQSKEELGALVVPQREVLMEKPPEPDRPLLEKESGFELELGAKQEPEIKPISSSISKQEPMDDKEKVAMQHPPRDGRIGEAQMQTKTALGEFPPPEFMGGARGPSIEPTGTSGEDSPTGLSKPTDEAQDFQGMLQGQGRILPHGELSQPLESGAKEPGVLLRTAEEAAMEVLERAQILREGEQSFLRVRLRPQALGEMEIRLSLKEGKLEGKILVETQDARQLLHGRIEELFTQWKGGVVEGIQLQVEVETGFAHSNSGGFHSFHQQEQSKQHAWRAPYANNATKGGFSPEAHEDPSQKSRGGIDLLA